jgi:hypothetical protein
MATNNLNQITTNLQRLSRDDLEKLFVIIRRILYPHPVDHKGLEGDPRERTLAVSLVCPHCSSTEVIKFGHCNQRQRYRCKNCRKTFGDYALYCRFAEAAIQKSSSPPSSLY